MAWNIGDEGFEMVLGNYVPHIIDDHIIGALEPLLSRDGSLQGLPYRDIRALGHPPGRPEHPGQGPVPAGAQRRAAGPGPGNPRGTSGNMSSATVLFVLKHILDLPAQTTPRTTAGPARARNGSAPWPSARA